MDRLLDSLCGEGERGLIVVAAPLEACAVLRGFGRDERLSEQPWKRHVLREGLELLMTGVGKANAAGAMMRAIEPAHDRVVVNCGIAGSLPGSNCRTRDAVVATRSVYADEGIETADGFVTCEEMGFGLLHDERDAKEMGVAADGELLGVLRSMTKHEGIVATVSTCSGTEARAKEVVARTGAIVEAMEGAAIGVSLRNLATGEGLKDMVRYGEFRIVSNTAGDRNWQQWDLKGALGVLGESVGLL